MLRLWAVSLGAYFLPHAAWLGFTRISAAAYVYPIKNYENVFYGVLLVPKILETSGQIIWTTKDSSISQFLNSSMTFDDSSIAFSQKSKVSPIMYMYYLKLFDGRTIRLSEHLILQLETSHFLKV